MKEARVLVGVPIPCDFRADARVVGMLESWRSYKDVTTYYPATSSAAEGQDKIVQFAMHMQPRPTHILFCDYDVLARPTTLAKLIAHDKDIISGVYPINRKGFIYWCCSKEVPFSPMPIDELPDNLFKAACPSNGIMLAKMEVFDKIQWPYWDEEKQVGGIKLGHDLYFFKKAREAGYDLWIDPKLKCNHFKTVDLLGIAKNYAKGKTK